MRASRPHPVSRKRPEPANFPPRKRTRDKVSLLVALLVLSTALLPSGTYAAPRLPGSGLGSGGPAPVVRGADYMLAGSQFSGDRNDSREQSFKGDLTLPAGAHDVTFTSGATKAPLDFSDVAPYWWAETPDGTTLTVELRTSRDGKGWSEWQVAEPEDVISPRDAITRTYAGLIPVDQAVRTHRYVQSRVSLHSDRPATTPVLHELSYTFINAGVTTNSPKAQVVAMGTASDVPRPATVTRINWGSPEGKSSPEWTPKYRRVTHIVIHHTATSNLDTDFGARVRAIWYYHSHTRGWGDIGYNYLIDPNGVIYEGRAGGDDVEAGHAYPFNVGTMGIGMIGTFSKVAPSPAAQSALIDLISWKANQRGIDPLGLEPIKGYTECGEIITYKRATISGHRDFKGSGCGKAFNTSSCPGDKLESMLPQIRAAIVADQPPLRAVFTDHDTPGNLNQGATVDVHLTVRNSGSLTWPATGQGAVTLGYRWLTPDGKPVQGYKKLTTPLPRNVPFADTVTITAKLAVPAQPGHYAVVWDLAQDGGWFSDGGSRPLQVDVVVGKDKSDTVAPTSLVLPLPVYSNDPEIPVRWAGKDDPKGSGLVSYDIQVRMIPQGQWTDWKMATADTQATYEGQDGYTYGFRSRARDAAGNVEVWRDEPSAYTTVDTRPPPIQVDSPVKGSYVTPGPLVVRGHTEPGTYIAVNDARAEEAGGVFTATVEAAGRDFMIHVTAADPAGNLSRLEITVQAAQRYSDVPLGHPDFIAIEYLGDQGIVTGYGDGTFRPDVTVTRIQFVKTLATAMHWGLIKPEEPRFSDVDPTSWMYPYAETAAARGVMDGFQDGTFLPGGSLSRATAIRSFAKAEGWKPADPKTAHFKDVSRTSYLFGQLEAAYAHGVITPDENGTFNPSGVTTRGAMSAMVYGLLADLIANSPPPPPDDQGP